MRLSPRDATAWAALRSRSGQITAGALVLSAVLHVLFLTLTPPRHRSLRSPPRAISPSTPGAGPQAVVIAPRPLGPVENAEDAELPTTVRRPQSPIATPADAPMGGPLEKVDSVSRTPGTRGGNPLIWNGFTDLRLAAGLPVLSPEEALREALAQPRTYVSPLRQCYDSLDAMAARARKAQDLSVTDGRGWRWGISADGIHLGPITVPVAPPSPPPGEVNWRPERDPCVDR